MIYYGLFHSGSFSLGWVVRHALGAHGNVELEEWGSFIRVKARNGR